MSGALQLTPDELRSLWRATPASLAATLSRRDKEPWIAAPHLRMLSKWMTEAATGTRPRVIVNLPPRHGKSFFISKWLPIWFLENWPHKNIINCGYATEFAERWGREVRNLATQHSNKLSFQLAPDSKARGRWNTTSGGGMIATGVGGQITGRGADCIPAGTLVTTENGLVDIADLVRMEPQQRPRVLSVNHSTGQAVWSRIVATKVSSASQLTEVTTRSGNTLQSTGRHLFFDTKHGYRQASILAPGDGLAQVISSNPLPDLRKEQAKEHRLPLMLQRGPQGDSLSELHTVQGPIRQASLSVAESPATGTQGHVLFGEMLPLTPRNKELPTVPPVSEAGETWPNVLLSNLFKSHERREQNESDLSGVQQVICACKQADHVLFASLREPGPWPKDERHGELAIHHGTQLHEAIQGHEAGHYRKGSRYLCRLQSNHGDNLSSSEGFADPGKDESGDSSHRRESEEQRTRESHSALRNLPRDTPQIGADSVSMVTKICCEQIPVYDIQVEGTHNFFANGILISNCLIVDDPIKDHQDANSSVQRERVWDWWKNTARTRLEPNGAIVILMTRWHEDDLVGRLLKEMAEGHGEHWDVLNLPAISGRLREENSVPVYPEQWEEDPEQGPCPLGRSPGQALWSARYPKEALDQLRRGTSEEAWAAQYQGKPANLVGAGNVYKSFTAAANVGLTLFNPRRPLVWSMDFNVDPMCSVFCQWDEEITPTTHLTNQFRKSIQVLQEMILPDSSTPEMCQAFLLRTEAYLQRLQGNPLKVVMYGDRSGNSRKTVGDTDYTTIKQFFRGHRNFNVSTKLSNANPAVKDRVNAVNMMLCNSFGERNTLIDPSCKELVKDFREVKWKRDQGGNTTGNIDKSDGARTHASDAYGYFVEKEFHLRDNHAGGYPGILR